MKTKLIIFKYYIAQIVFAIALILWLIASFVGLITMFILHTVVDFILIIATIIIGASVRYDIMDWYINKTWLGFIFSKDKGY